MATAEKTDDAIHIEEPRSNADPSKDTTVNETTDDVIVKRLETVGEEVGLTWRTVLAVLVSILRFIHLSLC